MAKGPEGLGGTVVSSRTEGYSGFSDPGGPTGSDVLYSGLDAAGISTILNEIAVPVPAEVEGQILLRGDGSLAFCNSAGLAATRACLMHIDAAQSKIDSGIPSVEVAVDIRKAAGEARLANDAAGNNSACIHHCRQALTKKCELATGEISSTDGKVRRPITDQETLDLIGVKTKNRRSEPEGRWVFNYFLHAALGDQNGFTPIKIDPHSPQSVLAEAYLIEWLSSRRPAGKKATPVGLVKSGSKPEQLKLDV